MITTNNTPTPNPEENAGLGGQPEVPAEMPSDEYPVIGREKRLLARAAKWNVKQEWRDAIVKRQVKDAIDPDLSPRDSNRAAKFVLDCDKHEEQMDQPSHQTNIAINAEGGEVQIVEDRNWYGNAHRLPTEPS